MNRTDLKRLQSVHGYPALSILAPMHRTSPENRQDPIRIKNLVKTAGERLQREFTRREVGPLLERLEKTAEAIDYRHTLDGIALFVARGFAEAHHLPFPVKERVAIDPNFFTRDLVFALNRSPRTWVLLLGERTTRLYSGWRQTLVEFLRPPFPMTDEEPDRGGAGRGDIKADKSAYADERHRHFFRRVDLALSGVLARENLPLIVVGANRSLGYFQEVTRLSSLVSGTLAGVHDKTPLQDLGKLVWPVVEGHLEKKRGQALADLDGAIRARKHLSGVQDAWQAASEGRIGAVLVEEGFYYPARIDGSADRIQPVTDPASPGVIDDAVDEILERVIAKGGRAIFVSDGALKDHGRIAAVLRY